MIAPKTENRSPHLRSVLGAALIFLVLLLTVAGVQSYRDLAAARAREALLEQRVEESRERIDGLTRRIELLQDDPATLERLAREELGLVYPQELVILLPEDEPVTAPPAAEDPPADPPAAALPLP